MNIYSFDKDDNKRCKEAFNKKGNSSKIICGISSLYNARSIVDDFKDCIFSLLNPITFENLPFTINQYNLGLFLKYFIKYFIE